MAEHAVTRSVRDSAALLDATSGPDIGDPYWAPPPARPFIMEVGADPGKLRIAFTNQAAAGVSVHEDCVRAVEDAAALCTDLGHEVVEAAPEMDGELIAHAFTVIWSSGCASTPDDPLKGLRRAEGFIPFTPICNITGQPAMSMPLLWNAEGLPIGTHFIGRFGDEATLFRLASQLEQARPWTDRRPPV